MRPLSIRVPFGLALLLALTIALAIPTRAGETPNHAELAKLKTDNTLQSYSLGVLGGDGLRSSLRELPDDPRKGAPKKGTVIMGQDTDGASDPDGGGGDGETPGGFDINGAPDWQGFLPVDELGDLFLGGLSTQGAAFFNDPPPGPDPTPGPAKGPGNVAFCFCVEPGEPDFATAPGYGNDWDQRLELTLPAPNPGAPTTVEISFQFNYDTEPGKDFFRFEVDRANTVDTRFALSGSNKDAAGLFTTPVNHLETFVVNPGEYLGAGLDQIRLRLRVTSDASGSDEDGLWPSDGAAQVDNILVKFNGGEVSFAPFTNLGSTGGWLPRAAEQPGNFGQLVQLLQDLDPCRENDSWQIGFVDDEQLPNPGGSTSPLWSYGPGGYVVNYTGGIGSDGIGIYNTVVSPAYTWDKSIPDDDDERGAWLKFDVWEHLPLRNGMFYVWHVRSFDSMSSAWTPWRDHNMVYYWSGEPRYRRVEVDISTLISTEPESLQIALGVIDLAEALELPGNDATPSPLFDNLCVRKYEIQGPILHARPQDLFQDSFPSSGADDWNADPLSLAVRLDMARDINVNGNAIVPGDSIIVSARPGVPGTTLLAPPVLKWILLPNPQFNPVRSLPPGAVSVPVLSGGCDPGETRAGWRGMVAGQPLVATTGEPVDGKFFFDLPDGNANPNAPYQSNEPRFFYPGDRLQYFIEAEDNSHNVCTVPADGTGFGNFRPCTAFPVEFTVRALPSLRPGVGGLQPPSTLVISNGGSDGRELPLLDLALDQNGIAESNDYDLFYAPTRSAGHSNGIGSPMAHGATANQLRGYDCIVFSGGDVRERLFSDGSNVNAHDKSNEIGVLSAWHALAGPRHIAYFGDNLVAGLSLGGVNGLSYRDNVLAVDFAQGNVVDLIDGQVAPEVAPTAHPQTSPYFNRNFIANACQDGTGFDAIRPRPGSVAVASHEFLTPAGASGAYLPSAAVWHARLGGPGPDPRVDLTLPFSLSSIENPQGKAPMSASMRAQLMGEILTAFGHAIDNGSAVPNDPAPARVSSLQQNHPNPFNPSTDIRFSLVAAGRASLRIYAIDGSWVRTLVDARLPAGSHVMQWDGRDARGGFVASGVYLYELRTEESRLSRKMALVR